MRLLLASRSRRRADLLAAAGFEFDVVPADVDERRLPGESPTQYAARVSADKARLVGRLNPGRYVIGADTIVVALGRVLGKPVDTREATEMLELLSGREHEVLTGVTIRCDERTAGEVAVTRVRFAHLTGEEIAWYVGTGEPDGKAGAYAVQGLASRYVERIDGSYSNVVGLPVATLYRLLRELRHGAV